MNNILNLITDFLINEQLDKTVLQDKEYIILMKQADTLMEKIKSFHFSKEETDIIWQLLSVYLSQDALQNKFAYQKGFKDCAALLTEIGIIKTPTK